MPLLFAFLELKYMPDQASRRLEHKMKAEVN